MLQHNVPLFYRIRGKNYLKIDQLNPYFTVKTKSFVGEQVCDNHKKHIHTPVGKKNEFFIVNESGIYRNHITLSIKDIYRNVIVQLVFFLRGKNVVRYKV
jgi:hypothetical protein